MDQDKIRQLQKQYNDDDYQDEDAYDELFQENTEELLEDDEAIVIQPAKGKASKTSGIITQVEQGSTQPKVQQEWDIPSDFFVEEKIVMGPQRKSDKGKKTLVLDLDETLVHSSFQPVEGADLVLPVEIEGTWWEVYVLKRPGVDEFLKRLHKHYELIIYTASLSKYADPLLNWLDPKNYCAYRLFREHCTYFNGIFVKDLSRLAREYKDTMIIDNSPTSYLFHPECAIPTTSWYDNQEDIELYQLCSILERLSKVDDWRVYLKQFISNNKVNFAKAAQILKGGRMTERSNSEPPADSLHKEHSPSPNKTNPKIHQALTKDERQSKPKLAMKEDSKTTDDRNKVALNILMNTWTPNNKSAEDQLKKFTMLNQYKAMGLHNMNPDMQKLLSSTLNSSNPNGRNHIDKDYKRSSKKNCRTRQHSANPKTHHSKRRKSPNRGRNDNSFGLSANKYEDSNTVFLNLMKNSLKSSKHKHKKMSSMNVSKGRDNPVINSIMPQTMTHIGKASIKKSSGKKSRASNTPKRGIKYSKLFGKGKGGSTRVSRKGSAANSNERGAYTTYVSQRASPKSKRNKPSIDYNPSNTNSFKFNNMMKDMGISFNYNNFQPSRYGARSRQGTIGSKKSSIIDSVIGNANKARERAQKMYSSGNIHTPTPNNNPPFYNDSKYGPDILMMNSNNNHHQHPYKLTGTGRGKTPHQKPGSPKRRKGSHSNKRSHSRPRSSKHNGGTKTNTFQAKFFDPKLLLSGYNMS